MTTIQARIDELQKELVEQQMAKAEQERRQSIITGSIEQLEQFCNISDKILDKAPNPRASSGCANEFPFQGPNPGETLKAVFKNRLDPKHPLYLTKNPHHQNVYPEFKDFQKYLRENRPHALRGTSNRLPELTKEIMKGEWERKLFERVYSTTSANDVYINESLKCILAIVKKQQKEIDWLKKICIKKYIE